MMPSILCIEIPTYRLCGFVGYFARSQIYALSSEPYALYSDSLLHKRTAQRRQLFHPFRYPCFSAQKTGDSQPLDVKTGDTQPTLSAACFVVQSCLADADFVVFSNYCLIGTRHMFVRFLWMLQTVKYPQRSKLPTFHTLSKVLKLHMSFNTVPILWLEGRAGMVRAS